MKVSLNFSNVKDMDLAIKFKWIGQKMKTALGRFPKTPVDLDEFIGLVDDYSQAIAVAADGSRTAISQRNKLRQQTTRMATHLGNYVGDVADEDIQVVYDAGFEPANRYRRLRRPLPGTSFEKVIRGPNSGTALAYIIPISRSNGKVAHYELGYAAKIGDRIGEFTVVPTTVARFPILIKNLTPGTTYIFQVRAFNKAGLTDWSDPVSFMAT